MNQNTRQHQWEQFAERVIPDDAPAVQINEMKLAFYAGANIMQVLTAAIADNDDEDAAVLQVDALYREATNEMEKMIQKKFQKKAIL
jgi:hypothetical protein